MTTTVSRHVSELVIQAKGIDTDGRKFTQALREVEKQAVKTETTMDKMGKSLKAFARTIKFTLVAAAAAAVTGLVRMASAFQRAERSLVTSTGAMGEQLIDLKDAVREVYVLAREPVTFEGLANLAGTLNALTGASGVPLRDLMLGLSEFAGLTDTNATTLAENFSRAANVFNVDVEAMTASLDTLYGVTQRYGIEAGELSRAIQEYGPVLQAAGFGFEEAAVMVGRFFAAGVSMSRISPAINQMLRRTGGNTEEVRKRFEELGKAMAAAGDTAAAVQIGGPAFGAEGITRLASAANQGAFELSSLNDEIVELGGSINASLDNTRTLATEWDRFMRVVGSIVEGPLTTLITKVTDVIEKLADWGTQVNMTRSQWAGNISLMIDAVLNISEAMSAAGEFIAKIWGAVTKAVDNAVLNTLALMSRVTKEAADLQGYQTFGITNLGDSANDNELPVTVTPGSDPPLASSDEQGKIAETVDLYREMDETIRRMYDRQLADRRAYEESLLSGPREMDAAIRKFVELEQAGNEALRSIGDSMDRNLAAGMTDFVFSIDKAKQSFGAFALSFLEQTGRMITQMVILNAITGGAGGGFGGLLGGFAKGGVFQGGNVTPFAKGGVVTAPMLFPMANGAGLIGEAGPEAVMPLGRNARGELGVKGGGTIINVNNYTGARVEVDDRGDVVDIAVRESVAAVRAEYTRDMKRGQGAFAQGFEGGYKNRRRLG